MQNTDRYRIVRRLGRGGMADVFEAVAVGSSGFERRVAIKRMRPDQASASFARMFLDEARIASHLHHANIVGVIDYGAIDGVPIQILEFVDGTDANRCRTLGRDNGTPMPLELGLHICIEVAHALDHAHRARDLTGRGMCIVHRDVSPSNILLSWDGDVKLTDFGIAFALDREEETRTGVTKGKILYMPPEQVLAGAVDGRSDLFALGCSVHSLLVGKSPLAGDDHLARLLTDDELPLDPSLPDDVRDLIRRATRRDKADRFENAAEMARSVGVLLAKRIDQDPRTLLREWLGKLRPSAEPTPQGRLDALLDVELVLTDDGAEGQRRFDATGSLSEPASSLPQVAEPDTQIRELGGRARAVPEPQRRSRIALTMLAAVALLSLAGAGWAWTWSSGAQPAVTPTDPPPTLEVAVALEPAPELPFEAKPSAEPTKTPVEDAPPAARNNPRRRRVLQRGPSTSASGDVRRAEGPTLAISQGFVAVGGRGARNAEIEVDGHVVAYAPSRIPLALGAHQIVLRLDGRVLAARSVEVQAHHTRSSPLRWSQP